MKPDTQIPNLQIEQTPLDNRPGTEVNPSVNFFESSSDGVIEKGGQKTEQNAKRSDITPITSLPTPIVASNTVVDDTKKSGMPLVAKDDDLIEKEWVDKAKQIVNQTKDNPHQQDKEITELQVDYLKKRFGRELGAAE